MSSLGHSPELLTTGYERKSFSKLGSRHLSWLLPANLFTLQRATFMYQTQGKKMGPCRGCCNDTSSQGYKSSGFTWLVSQSRLLGSPEPPG